MIWRGTTSAWDQHKVALAQRTYSKAIEIVVPELLGQTALIPAVVAELRNRNLTTMTSPDSSFPQGGLLTNLTAEFLNFVLNPEELP